MKRSEVADVFHFVCGFCPVVRRVADGRHMAMGVGAALRCAICSLQRTAWKQIQLCQCHYKIDKCQ